MKILLTGASGQVGYELERSLQSIGEVVALDRTRCDLSDLDQVRDVVRALRPGLIVNPAAYTAGDKAETEAALAHRINAEAPAVMAAEAQRLGAAMVHYSTDYVFDGTKSGPYLETDATNPINVYGQSKLAGELAIAASGAPHLILRTSWVYGMRGKNFLLTMLRLGRERDELRVVADQHGAPTWSRTIADTTAALLAQARAGGAGVVGTAFRDVSPERTRQYHLARFYRGDRQGRRTGMQGAADYQRRISGTGAAPRQFGAVLRQADGTFRSDSRLAYGIDFMYAIRHARMFDRCQYSSF
jgi:dTDP-4-dehydrorhamnose reductase